MDAQFIYSEDQAETTVAAHASTKSHDHGSQGLPINQPLWIEIVVTETYTSGGAATGQFKFQTDDNTGFASATDLFDSGALALATLVQGYIVLSRPVSESEIEGFTQCELTIGTAVMTAGKFSAYLTTNPTKNYT